MRKKAVVAMSGGVDSSVTAALLKEQGYDVIGMHLNFWTEPHKGAAAESGNDANNKCCTLEGLEDARYMAGQIGIPFYVMNVADRFKSEVVDYFLETYRRGETPNPCVECNRKIKFGDLFERAISLGADYFATGHYAAVERNVRTGGYELKSSRDSAKDQTYFLYALTQEKLSRILFPLGNMLKSEVYELAAKFGLYRAAEKPQSQGLCFFSESSPKFFLRRHLPSELFKPGPIMSLDGRVLGEHKGLPLYTAGQRSRLGIGGIKGESDSEPWYVVKIDAAKNALIVGREKDILSYEIIVGSPHFISGAIPENKINVSVRIRHRGIKTPAIIEFRGASAIVRSASPLRGVARGQAAVFYNGDTVLGGGTIIGESINYEKKIRERLQVAY